MSGPWVKVCLFEAGIWEITPGMVKVHRPHNDWMWVDARRLRRQRRRIVRQICDFNPGRRTITDMVRNAA